MKTRPEGADHEHALFGVREDAATSVEKDTLVLDQLQDRVDMLARMTVLSDCNDLVGLVALQEQAVVLASELSEQNAGEVAELAKKISSLAEAIVMRSTENADAAFAEIGQVIDRMNTAVSNLTAGAQAAPAPSEKEDRELIAAWVSGCEQTLSDLEGKLLSLEKTPNDAEVIGDIRRTMHTLKGECGVLSLAVPQKLCHEAESLIDARLEAGAPVPIDPLLALLDWLKNFVTALGADHSAKPTGGEPVLNALLAARGEGDSGAAAPAPATPSPAVTAAPALASTPSTSVAAPAAAAIPTSTLSSPAPKAPVEAPKAAPVAATPAPSIAAAVEAIVDPTPVRMAPQTGTEENLPDFLCEAKDHLANAEEALLQLDQDRGNKELINTVFRAFHTIKGVSGFMALLPIVSLAHSAEQLLDGARSGTIALERSDLNLILASCDTMARLLGVLEGGASPTQGELKTLVARLDAAAGPTTRAAALAAGAAAMPVTPVAAPTPVAVEATPGARPVPTASVAAPAATVEPKATGENGEDKASSGTTGGKKGDQTVKVSTTRMDSLVTMVGELVIAQQMVVQDVLASKAGGQRLQRTLGHMSSMIRELQEVSMSLRMVNLKGTFQKMTRLVRDVSLKAGKQIEVITDGEDVELDRNVVEAITDPLVHMIRNACDHGVEGPDDRRAAGKPATGKVSLRAYHAGGSIVIEIADDGRGLRREKLLAKAKSKGLLPADLDEASMPDSEAFALIFLPGFSTAEKVTDISGRGVGMDVVKRNIEALRGKVEIRSVPGEGTTFLLRLPLTMAIIDGMVVRVGKQRYVLPTLSIQQSFRPGEAEVKTVVGAGEMVMVRGSMLPVYRLNRVLGLGEGCQNIAEGLLIVMESNDGRFCLMVDEILGQHSVVIKTLTQTGQKLEGVSGGAILGDGLVALILDVGQLAELARKCENIQTTVVTRRADSGARDGTGAAA